MATGPWDPTRAGTSGRNRFLASDADRERVIDVLKTAFVQGVLTKDELAVRTGHALKARTYGHLAAITTDLAARSAEARKPAKTTAPPAPATKRPAGKRPARKRLTKKVVAWGACAIILPSALSAAFFTYYGGFLVIFAFTFIGTMLTSKSPAPRRPAPAPMSGRR